MLLRVHNTFNANRCRTRFAGWLIVLSCISAIGFVSAFSVAHGASGDDYNYGYFGSPSCLYGGAVHYSTTGPIYSSAKTESADCASRVAVSHYVWNETQ